MPIAARTAGFTESVIREMTRLITRYHPEDGINLAQGFPDFPAPPELKDAPCEAIQGDVNQYAVTWGSQAFREGIAAKTSRFLGIDFDPETEITVCCGATEAMISTMLAVLNPGDEVVIFEPFYENYGPDCTLPGAVPRFVPLRPPDWTFDADELAAAFGPRTCAIVINTPNNPTGKVFSRVELETIASLCQQHDCLAITDEIYEHMVYDGHRHESPATIPGMRERTVVINGMSKTFSVTGWRVGYALAPPLITAAIRKVHDFLTVGAPAPLQFAGATAMKFGDEYYQRLCREYQARRDFIMPVLDKAGLHPYQPSGAYYVMCDISSFGYADDVSFARHLVQDLGIAVVPGSSFYHDPSAVRQQIRIAFPKRLETLRRSESRFEQLAEERAKLTVSIASTAPESPDTRDVRTQT